MIFFGLRNKFENVQGNKKRNTQNIEIKKQKKPNDIELLFVDKQKGLIELITMQWSRTIKPKSQNYMYQNVQ